MLGAVAWVRGLLIRGKGEFGKLESIAQFGRVDYTEVRGGRFRVIDICTSTWLTVRSEPSVRKKGQGRVVKTPLLVYLVFRIACV